MSSIMVRLSAAFSLICALGGCFGSKLADIHAQIDMKRLAEKANIIPVAVIGSGPAGIMAAIYCVRGGKDTLVIEGNKPGGLLMDTTEVENWPGEKSIQGPVIIENLRTQATHQGVAFITDAVERIDKSSWPYTIYTESGKQFHALSIIIATGASPRKLGVPGEETYWGGGVTSCAVCDGPFYKGQEVVVVGGGDSAIEEAIQLASYAKKITVLVRKDRMRAAIGMHDRLKDYGQIQVKYNVTVQRILGDGQLVTGVELYDSKTGERSIFPTSGVFLAIGHDPNTQFIKGAVPTDAQGYIIVEGRTQETEVPGIFAAGDVADFRYRQAGTSAGQGISAGLDAVRFLDDIGFTPEIEKQYAGQLFCADQAMTRHEGTQKAVRKLNTMDEVRTLIKEESILVLDFWAETCPSCKLMLPVFKTVAQDFVGRVTFATVNTDEAPEIAQELFVHKVPYLMIFKNGYLTARYAMVMSRNELATLIEQALDGTGV